MESSMQTRLFAPPKNTHKNNPKPGLHPTIKPVTCAMSTQQRISSTRQTRITWKADGVVLQTRERLLSLPVKNPRLKKTRILPGNLPGNKPGQSLKCFGECHLSGDDILMVRGKNLYEFRLECLRSGEYPPKGNGYSHGFSIERGELKMRLKGKSNETKRKITHTIPIIFNMLSLLEFKANMGAGCKVC